MTAATEVTIFFASPDQSEAYALQSALVSNGVAAQLAGIDEKTSSLRVLLCSTASREDFALSQALKATRGTPLLIVALEDERELTARDLPPVLTSERDANGNLRAIEPPEFFAHLNKAPFEAHRLSWMIRDQLGLRVQDNEPAQKRGKTAGIAAYVAAVLAVGGGAFGWMHYQANQATAAELRQTTDFSDRMLLYMAERLPDEVRPDVLTDLGEQAIILFAATRNESLSDEALSQRARILHFIAEARDANGDIEGAQEAFELAHRLTGEHLARNPENEIRRFAHSQSAFWVGASAYRRGALEDAAVSFETYSALVHGLADDFPENLTYRAETGHAAINSAVIHFESGEYDAAAATLERAVAQFTGEVLSSAAASIDDRANALAWLADARHALGDFEGAIAAREEEIALRVGDASPERIGNYDAIRIANAQFRLSETLTATGDTVAAAAVTRAGLGLISPVRDAMPENVRTRHLYTRLTVQHAGHLRREGALMAAKLMIDEARAQLEDDEAGASDERHLETATLADEAARIALAFGQYERAELEAMRAVQAMEAHIDAGYIGFYGRLAASHLLLHDIRRALGQVGDAERALRNAAEVIAEADLTPWKTADLAARIEWLKGEEASARDAAVRLREQGYAHPEFIAFWRAERAADIATIPSSQEPLHDG